MRKLLSLAIGLALLIAAPARADLLVADLSSHEIEITAAFSGAELLLFGAVQGEGEVIVVVSGPDRAATVRKKDKVGPIWINTESVAFDKVPGFYHVSATNSLSGAALDQVLRENGVGLRYLNLAPAAAATPERAAAFRAGLLRRKAAQGLYSAQTGHINLIEDTLFRTNISFPANVPTGTYQVMVYQVVDGWMKLTTTIPLTVHKVGMEAAVFRFAHDYPALYGILAIVMAAVAGYGAGMLFGRR